MVSPQRPAGRLTSRFTSLCSGGNTLPAMPVGSGSSPSRRPVKPRRRAGSLRRWGVIADDLTGATDVAAMFVAAGFGVRVILNPRARASRSTAVTVLSSNTRQAGRRAAAARAKAAARWLRRRGAAVIYKKMDSTLQGNIVAEVEAIRDGAGFGSALVCPANPRQGRFIRGGQLAVRGEARRSVAQHLAAQGLRDFVSVHRPLSLRSLLASLRRSRFVLADGAGGGDLRLLARAAFAAGVLPAGSAGLARELAVLLARKLPFGRTNPPAQPAAHPARPVLLVCGSTNPVTARQLHALRAAGRCAELSFPDRPDAVLMSSVRAGANLVLRVPVHRRPASHILRWLRTLTPWLRARLFGSWLLTGGDTALLVCRWLRPRALLVGGEISPGLAWGRWDGGLADGLPVGTKPGGFGKDRSLIAAVRFLRGERSERVAW